MLGKTKETEVKKIRALMVDDNYDYFLVLKASIGTDMELEYSPDGFTAFQMFKKDHYDVILCDIFMPLLNGLDLLGEFKRKNINVPFLFISGNADQKIIKEAFQLGAFNLLEKPVSASDLFEKTKMAIQLHAEEDVESLGDQEKAYICNTLKTYYYDIDRIMHLINKYHIPVSDIYIELDKKIHTGRCIFDDPANLKIYRAS